MRPNCNIRSIMGLLVCSEIKTILGTLYAWRKSPFVQEMGFSLMEQVADLLFIRPDVI